MSLKGLQFVGQLAKEITSEVDSYLYAPAPNPKELLGVKFIAGKQASDVGTASGDGPKQRNRISSILPTDFDDLPHREKHLSKKLSKKVSHMETIRVIGGDENGENEAGDGEESDEFDDEDGIGYFLLVASSGFSKRSTVTGSEDVSYVSSPYLPKSVRNPRDLQPFTSNAHRRHESSQGGSNIRDELDEAIVLVGLLHGGRVDSIFGSNQIVALNERLGALDQCQGGLFTASVDSNPTDTKFEVDPGLTSVKILDYDFVRYINFEAEIDFPEDEGVVQIENFGMHLNVDGTIINGIKIEAIMDRTSESISLDHLSRVLVDVHQDSSTIMNDLLSNFQSSL